MTGNKCQYRKEDDTPEALKLDIVYEKRRFKK